MSRASEHYGTFGVIAPSLVDARDRPLPVRAAAAQELPLERFLPTKEQTFQGHQGSCVWHGITQSFEDQIWMTQGIRTDLSIAVGYWLTREVRGWQDRDTGCFMRDAIDVCRRVGVAPAALGPYDPDSFRTPPSALALEVAARNRAGEFFSTPTALDCASAINAGAPVVLCLNIYGESWDRAGATGVLPGPIGSLDGAHCIELDGFSRVGGRLRLLGKNWHRFRPDGGPWGIPHPLNGSDVRFAEHVQGRLWLEADFVDSTQVFDTFSVLRFPLEVLSGAVAA